MATTGPRTHAPLARRVREQFVADLGAGLEPLADAIRLRLIELAENVTTTRDRQERRDAMLDFERAGGEWLGKTQQGLQRGLMAGVGGAPARVLSRHLELIGDEVVEQKILASRLSMAIGEKVAFELNDLKVRMQHLEGGVEMSPDDIFQPEAATRIFIEHWHSTGLPRSTWVLVADVINAQLVPRFVAAYKRCNELLIDKGILPDIDLSARVKRGVSAPQRPDSAESQPSAMGASSRGSATSPGGVPVRPGGAAGSSAGGNGGGRGGAGASAGSAFGGGVAEETRLMTSSTPLARARMRATGVIGQLKRMLTDRVAGFDPERSASPSPGLQQALAQQQMAHAQTQHASTQRGGSTMQEELVYDDAAVERVAGDLRQRTGELKRKASTQGEKATIEIVALMFQSILAEERIPAAIRVWFARLQMPVLRVALAEPEFFGTLQHPARQLIDRMGSCVMGFDASSIGGSALEVEIRRVVQVIEQYPETGRRVFQLVYDEFQKFLSRFLTEGSSTQRLVSVAQQVEQKETMAVQYTIELRSMLDNLPVRDEIREFLFKVWAEVLALAAVKNGPQHEETLALKKSAADLVWAASAKPNRNDRTRVINDLPKLLLRLRQGMALLGIEGPEQENHIKVIGDTLADAFMSKTEAIPQAQIDAMSRRLENLEDFVSDEPDADLALDPDSIEMLLGIDASMIEVVADGGSKPSDAMLAWARELQLGTWFSLDHNGKTHQVQYAWCSDRKQLHLFASSEGRSFLVQAKRLASYLQAGLLLPNEEEALTIRATRDALAKLDANPERLLS